MYQYSKINQIAASTDENVFGKVSNNSTIPLFAYHFRKSDSLSQAELLRFYQDNIKNMALFAVRLNACENRLSQLEKKMVMKLEIRALKRYELRQPLEAILEPDDGGFIARTVDLPVFGYGEDTIEAIDNLKHEIESLYSDLMEDDNFSEDWLITKKFLMATFRKK